jgi:hypothetical protein
MNPLHWKREHQIALTAISLGWIIGYIIGRHQVCPYSNCIENGIEYTKFNGAKGWVDLDWLWITAYCAGVAVIFGLVVYIVKLMRT